MKGKEKVPIRADDSVTEDDKLVIPQNTGNVKAAPATAGLDSSSGKKCVQPVPPRVPVLNPRASNDKQDKAQAKC